MAEITGSAKKFSGEAANLIIIFDWFTGSQIATITPNTSTGAWSYFPLFNHTAGITYIAYGCKPITHGPYELIGGKVIASSGFLLLAIAESGTNASGLKYNPSYDRNNQDTATWNEYFSQVMLAGLHQYKYGPTVPQTIAYTTRVIEQFSMNWKLLVSGYNTTFFDDTHKWTLELLTEDNVVVAAVRSEKKGPFAVGFYYGKSLTSFTAASTEGPYPSVNGVISFSGSGIYFTRDTRANNFNHSFFYAVDLSLVTKIRVGGSATSTYDKGGSAGGFIRILPPT